CRGQGVPEVLPLRARPVPRRARRRLQHRAPRPYDRRRATLRLQDHGGEGSVTATARSLARTAWVSIGGDEAALDSLSFTDGGDLPSTYAVTDLACASIGVATLAVSELIGHRGKSTLAVTVDRRLASFW